MISKQDLIELFKKEFATTSRVMKAYPSGKDDFTPHERSSNAMTLASTFVFEMYLLEKFIFGEPIDSAVFKSYHPANMNSIAEDFEKEGAKVIARFQDLHETELKKPVSFGGADICSRSIFPDDALRSNSSSRTTFGLCTHGWRKGPIDLWSLR